MLELLSRFERLCLDLRCHVTNIALAIAFELSGCFPALLAAAVAVSSHSASRRASACVCVLPDGVCVYAVLYSICIKG